MTSTQKRALRQFLAALLLLAPSAFIPMKAQSDTIIANPNAVKLRRIWMMRGATNGGEQVGFAAGTIGDVNHDGFADFGVYVGKYRHLRLFYGSPNPSTVPFRIVDSMAMYKHGAVVGDFWGTGNSAVGLNSGKRIDSFGRVEYHLSIFRTEADSLDIAPSAVWSSVISRSPYWLLYPSDMIAADLDQDGADELIVPVVTWEHGDTISKTGQVWIYKGGPNFQVDQPTVVLRDYLNSESRFDAGVARLNGGRFPELFTIGGNRPDVHVYWGRAGLPTQEGGFTTLDKVGRIVTLDCDGDGIDDIMYRHDDHSVGTGTYVYLTGRGKNPRTRTFSLQDADVRMVGNTNFVFDGGPMNDSSGRFSMIGIRPSGPSVFLVLSGGLDGPDAQYEGWYTSSADGLTPGDVLGNGGGVGDVDGDGWSDFLTANDFYPGEGINSGIAVLLAGGPYIPHDEIPLSAINEIPLEGRTNGLTVWPNPISSELNIAWRGDLTRMPRHFEVHDLLGRKIASGEVSLGGGSALWRCSELSAGTYVVSVTDGVGSHLASVRIIKQ